jgi:hypothetical protein
VIHAEDGTVIDKPGRAEATAVDGVYVGLLRDGSLQWQQGDASPTAIVRDLRENQHILADSLLGRDAAGEVARALEDSGIGRALQGLGMPPLQILVEPPPTVLPRSFAARSARTAGRRSPSCCTQTSCCTRNR